MWRRRFRLRTPWNLDPSPYVPSCMLQDLRFAFRSYLKTPGFVVVAVLALALGIGANTAMFSALDAVLLRQLPYRDPRPPGDDLGIEPSGRRISSPAIARRPQRRAGMEAAEPVTGRSWLFQADARRTSPARTSRNRWKASQHPPIFWSLLGVQTALGRGFAASDSPGKSGSVAIISHALFERKFAKDPGAIGKTIHVDEAPYTIVGVLPAEFHLPAMWEGFDQKKPDVWLTMSAAGMSEDGAGRAPEFHFWAP